MRNPLYNIASFFSNKAEATVANKAQKQERMAVGYQEALRDFAFPLGEYLSDEFDSARELFEFLEEEQVLPRETFLLLKHDREFCRKFEEGLKAGAEDDECYDDDYYDDEYGEDNLYESEEAQLEEMNEEDQSEYVPLPHNPLSL